MLETGVEVWFQTQLNDNRVVVAVNMSVDSVKALEDLAYQCRKGFRERHACFDRYSA